MPATGWDAFPPRRLLLAVDGKPFALRQHQDVLRQLLHVAAGSLAVARVADDSHARLRAASSALWPPTTLPTRWPPASCTECTTTTLLVVSATSEYYSG